MFNFLKNLKIHKQTLYKIAFNFNSTKLGFIIIFTLIATLTLIYSYVKIPNDAQIVETMNIPVTNKIIIIDAGHGLPDKGAENDKGISEEKINLQIAIKLQNILESSGATVLLTRSDENGIYENNLNTIAQKKVSDIKNRVKIGNESAADIFISIHLNNFSSGKYFGWQTFYKENDDKSKKLAGFIQKNLNETISNENKRTIHTLNDIYIMKHVEIPIALVECGFLSNTEESENLQNENYQLKLAWGIYDGIIDYFAN